VGISNHEFFANLSSSLNLAPVKKQDIFACRFVGMLERKMTLTNGWVKE